jgi:hypothetical protein
MRHGRIGARSATRSAELVDPPGLHTIDRGRQATGNAHVRARRPDVHDSNRQKLSKGGDPAAQVCGWLKDRHGHSWQRAFAEMMRQKKPDIAAVQRAYDG